MYWYRFDPVIDMDLKHRQKQEEAQPAWERLIALETRVLREGVFSFENGWLNAFLFYPKT